MADTVYTGVFPIAPTTFDERILTWIGMDGTGETSSE